MLLSVLLFATRNNDTTRIQPEILVKKKGKKLSKETREQMKAKTIEKKGLRCQK